MAVSSRTIMQITREMQALATDPSLAQNCVTIQGMLSDSDPLTWIIHLLGPPETYYAGGIFRCIFRYVITIFLLENNLS